MKKILTIIATLFCLVFSGCSLVKTEIKPIATDSSVPAVVNQIETASSTQNKTVNVVAEDTVTPDVVFAGKTLYDLATEFKKSAASSTPEEENSILQSIVKELSFMKDCRRGTLLEDENIVSKIISETSLYYCAENKNGFAKNIEIALAVQAYQNCLAKNSSQAATLGGQYYFYKTYSLSFAANFAIDSILKGSLEKHPDWCQENLTETEKEYCLNLNNKSIANELLQYYKITGIPQAFAQSAMLYKDLGYSKSSVSAPENSEQSAIDKMATIKKSMEENSKYPQCSATITAAASDEMSLPGGIIESVDDLILGAEDKIKDEILGKADKIVSILDFSKQEISDTVSGAQYAGLSSTLLAFAHPEKGVRFSPSPIIDLKNNVVLKPEDAESIVKDKTLLYNWGNNSEGKNIKMGFNDFSMKVIYDKNYAHTSGATYNKFAGQIKVDYQGVYPKSRFVEYSFPAQNGEREHALWLFFEVYDNEWYLVGMVHS